MIDNYIFQDRLDLDLDDLKTTEDYLEAFRKLNSFQDHHVSQINSLNVSILKKREELSSKYQECLALEQELKELEFNQSKTPPLTIDKAIEDSFTETMLTCLVNYGDLEGTPEGRLNKVILTAPLEIGQTFGVYINTQKKEPEKIVVIKNDTSKTEKELTREEMLTALADIGFEMSKEIQKVTPYNEREKLTKLQLGSIFLDFCMKKD